MAKICGKSRILRKSATFELTQKQLSQLAAFDRFQESQAGVYPASVAALALRMTPQGVYQAAQRGWIAFVRVGRDRWYSRRDVVRYRFERSKKFFDNRPLPERGPRDMSAK